MTVEEFRAAIKLRAARFDASPAWWNIIRLLKPFDFIFYGERGTIDGVFPPPCQSRSKSRWKMKARRNTGKKAVRIEECAKRGPFKEVQGGLMNQP